MLDVLATSTNTLTKLSLTGVRDLSGVPAGPYLSSLESLELKGDLARLPRALASATRLRCLNLQGHTNLRISMGDVERTLRPLQRLTELRLYSWSKALDPPAAASLFRALPLLKAPNTWERMIW